MRGAHVLALVPCLAFLPACSSGGGSGVSPIVSPDPAVQTLAKCIGIGLRNYDLMVKGYLDFIEAMSTPTTPPAGVTWDPKTGEFQILLDLDGNGATDATLTGKITTSLTPLADGFQQGERFSFDWTVTGSLNGSGNFFFSHNGGSLPINAKGSFTDSSGCSFDTTDLTVTLLLPQKRNFEAVGAILFTVRDGPDSMSGLISFAPQQDASIDVTYQGNALHFYIDLVTFQPYAE